MNERADDELLGVKLNAYRDAFRHAFIAYLIAGHRMSASEAHAEAERVIAETDRRIEAEQGGTTR